MQRMAYNIILDVLSNKFGHSLLMLQKHTAIYVAFSNRKFSVFTFTSSLRSNLLHSHLKFLLMSMKILLAILVNKVH
ncbi:hypothetical protein H5410_049866 [Solanum commersonii]|uniref:Uncharacterized protein n=1 Tax=Solanum commersonii TaxID=4109 RepID=A0A9J5WV92_SOLCO|nr:hypothetical protein H5410_049866 [Solanum commersonii]